MFVLDALRRLKKGTLTIPSFHLGHLGFRPGLKVDSQFVELERAEGHELILTPFQGSRDNLFIFKCIFKERAGVVASALSAFAHMDLNVLSLESATIDRDTKHVLFCILSWDTAKNRYQKPVPLDESAKNKFIDLLPLLPTLDKRYLDFLEIFILFCFDALEYEEVPGRHDEEDGPRYLPRISIKPFDDFYARQNWRTLQISRRRPGARSPRTRLALPSVYIQLPSLIGRKKNSRALLFSETETKSLHIVFPRPGREGRFLHIGFTHENRPGALLLIAKLLEYCDLSIKTSLLRQHSSDSGINVWETMVEYVGSAPVGTIPSESTRGVEWFRKWCFDKQNPNKDQIKGLTDYLQAYRVEICRPSYPRSSKDKDRDFAQIKLVDSPRRRSASRHHATKFDVRPHHYTTRLVFFDKARESHEPYRWFAEILYPKLNREFPNGRVFVSIPRHCTDVRDLIKEKIENELGVEVVTYDRGNAANKLSIAATDMIRDADFFLGVWHPDEVRPNELSVWMPFEFGAARALGKPVVVIVHEDIPDHQKLRIEKDFSLIDYVDLNLRDKITEDMIPACRTRWRLTQRIRGA